MHHDVAHAPRDAAVILRKPGILRKPVILQKPGILQKQSRLREIVCRPCTRLG